MVAVTEDADWVDAPLEPTEIISRLEALPLTGSDEVSRRITRLRQELMAQCQRLHGNHNWHLQLKTATPNVVTVYCSTCPANLDDVWTGKTAQIHMDLPTFRVVDGTHNAAEDVDMPLDVYVRESQNFSRGSNGSIGYVGGETEVRVSPRGQQQLPGPPEVPSTRGTGWCSPSP